VLTPVRAVALTGEAARRLATPRTGRVHSVFDRTVNVVLDGAGDGGWLSLHGPSGPAMPLPSPFGIACPALAPSPGWVGSRVAAGHGVVLVGTGLRVTLDGARERDTSLPRHAPMPPVDSCLARAAGPEGRGLLGLVAGRLGGMPARSAPPPGGAAGALLRCAGAAVGLLAGAMARGDAAAWRRAAGALLGLGPGLTPAGDDLLLGALAGAAVSGPQGRMLVAQVGGALLEDARTRTGPWSRAFLAAALAGVVAEPLHRFVTGPDPGTLDALLASGATSGADGLAGYLLARCALAGTRAAP
jgi:hypothetical protein